MRALPPVRSSSLSLPFPRPEYSSGVERVPGHEVGGGRIRGVGVRQGSGHRLQPLLLGSFRTLAVRRGVPTFSNVGVQPAQSPWRQNSVALSPPPPAPPPRRPGNGRLPPGLSFQSLAPKSVRDSLRVRPAEVRARTGRIWASGGGRGSRMWQRQQQPPGQQRHAPRARLGPFAVCPPSGLFPPLHVALFGERVPQVPGLPAPHSRVKFPSILSGQSAPTTFQLSGVLVFLEALRDSFHSFWRPPWELGLLGRSWPFGCHLLSTVCVSGILLWGS